MGARGRQPRLIRRKLGASAYWQDQPAGASPVLAFQLVDFTAPIGLVDKQQGEYQTHWVRFARSAPGSTEIRIVPRHHLFLFG